MDKKNINSEIQNLLEAISEQTEVICTYEQKIPQIELDIVKVNIRNLYDAYIQLDKLNKQTEKPITTTSVPPTISNQVEEKMIIEPPIEKIVQITEVKELEKEIISEPAIKDIVEDIIEEIKKEVEPEKESYVKPSIEFQNPAKSVEKPIEPPIEKTVKKAIDLFSDPATMSDKFKNDTQSINDKIAQSKVDATVAGKINRVPVDDLKKAIGINEKFRFVNELFEGNLTDYTDAITKLNAFDTLENALQLLNFLAVKHKWDNNSNTFATLKELVNRRYVN